MYYTGITTVGSAIYAKVPNDIRKLLAQERFGNFYMRFLSFLTFLCLLLVAFRISNHSKIFLAIPFVTLASGVGIFAFVKLGQRAFNLFDPTALSDHIFQQIQRWLETVKSGGFQWMDNSFQFYAYTQASATLDTLETLADITAKEQHLNGAPFVDLSNNILRFLIYYEQAKRKIPTESRWYEQKYKHHDWYRTDDSRVAIAHQTGTTIQPDVTNNNEWVEDRALRVVTTCLEVNLASAKYSEVLRLLEYIDAYLKCLSMEGRLTKAFSLMQALATTVIDSVAKESQTDFVEVEVVEKLAILERLASLPITVALGYRETLEKLSRRNVESRIDTICWSDNFSLYNVGFSAYCLSRIEWFRPRLVFEEDVDGYKITPDWYKLELILQVEAKQFIENIRCLISDGTILFKSIIDKSTRQKRPWLAAAAMSREWEYWHKIERHLEMWPNSWTELSGQRKIEGLTWSMFDIEEFRTNCNQRRGELLKTMSQQSTLLALFERPEGFPDYAGQFIHTAGEVAFDALLTNNVDLLKSIFKSYMSGCLIRFDTLRPKSGSTDWRAQLDFKIASAALLDVMDISGFARLLADYHNNEALWTEIIDAWNTYLEKSDRQLSLELLAAAITVTDIAFEIPHRGVLRTTWHQKINQRLADVPCHEEYRSGYLGSDTVIDHKSALIRIFAREPYGSFHDGIDIFITFYLGQLKDGKDLNFSFKRRNLLDSIERESKRQ